MLPSQIRQEIIRRSEEREQRMNAMESDIADIKHSLCQRAHKEALQAQEASRKNYQFRTSSVHLVSLADIAVDVDRRNPIAEVVLQGTKYKNFHYVLVHDSLTRKAAFIMQQCVIDDTAPSDLIAMRKIFTDMEEASSTVYAYNVSSSPYTFSEIMQIFERVRSTPLRDFNEFSCVVTVRYR